MTDHDRELGTIVTRLPPDGQKMQPYLRGCSSESSLDDTDMAEGQGGAALIAISGLPRLRLESTKRWAFTSLSRPNWLANAMCLKLVAPHIG